MTHSPAVTLTAHWERPVVASTGDRTALMLRLATGPAPAGGRERAPLDVAFALDRSGSMSGKIDLAKAAILVAIDHLDARDRVAVVAFDSALETVQPLAPATPAVNAALRAALRWIEPRASTYLSGGWLEACRRLADAREQGNGHAPRLQRSVLLTDGLANVGITDGAELAHHAGQLRARGVSTSAIGLGTGFDEFLLSGMVEAGGGTFAFAAQASELEGFFREEIGDLLAVVAARPVLEVTWPEGLRARLINAFPASRHGRTHTIDLRDVRSEEELKLLFTVRSLPDVPGPLRATVQLRWTDPVSGETRSIAVDTEPLLCVDPEEAATFPKDPAVSEPLALEQAALAHREAIRLDREGRYQESREVFAASVGTLEMAPQTDAIREQGMVAARLARAPMTALGEDIRKERIAHHSRHSRGSARPRPPR